MADIVDAIQVGPSRVFVQPDAATTHDMQGLLVAQAER